MSRPRIAYGILTIALLAVECYIGCFVHHSWVRSYLGDTLVIVLLYCAYRTAFPHTPKPTLWLPVLLLLFCACVEGLQAWHLVDRLHIEHQLLRVLIGTSFSWVDLLSYTVGAIPIAGVEWWRSRRLRKRTDCS